MYQLCAALSKAAAELLLQLHVEHALSTSAVHTTNLPQHTHGICKAHLQPQLVLKPCKGVLPSGLSTQQDARGPGQHNPTLPMQPPNSAAGPSQLVYKRLKGLLAAVLHMYANSSESNCPCDTIMYRPRWHPHSRTNSTEPTKTLMSAATPAHGTRTNLQSRALPTTQQRDAGALTRHTCMAWHPADRDTPLNNHNTNTGPWQWQGAAGHTLIHSHRDSGMAPVLPASIWELQVARG